MRKRLVGVNNHGQKTFIDPMLISLISYTDHEIKIICDGGTVNITELDSGEPEVIFNFLTSRMSR